VLGWCARLGRRCVALPCGGRRRRSLASADARHRWISQTVLSDADPGAAAGSAGAGSAGETTTCAAALVALAALFDNLPLKTCSASPDAAFQKHFGFLARLVERYQAQGDADSLALTVAALSRLLEANVDVGLPRFLAMAFGEPPAARAAFLAVRLLRLGLGLCVCACVCRLLSCVLLGGAQWGFRSTHSRLYQPH
jgi:hypothetical protein